MAKKAKQQRKKANGDVPFSGPDWPASRGTVMVKVAAITPHPENPRVHPDAQVDGLGKSMFDEFGVVMPPVVDENNRLIAGEGRWLSAKKRGVDALPCIVVRGWSESKKRRFMVADNRLPMLAGFDDAAYSAVLALIKDEGLPLDALGFDDASLAAALAAEAGRAQLGNLAESFGVPPFTVLTAREGWWQDRKRAWIALGIQSELGRGAAPGGSMQPTINPETGKICRADSKGRPVAGTDAKRSRQANAIPGGQRGGMNPKNNPVVRKSIEMAENRRKLQARAKAAAEPA